MKLRRLSLTGGTTKEPARSKAVDDLLETDLELEMRGDASMRSFASSITSPPSQTGSFYRRVQQQHETNESDHSDYSYENNHLAGCAQPECISDSTEDDNHSTNTWGGDANSTDSGPEESVKSSSSFKQARTSIKSRKSKSFHVDGTKKKKKKKGKKRLKDYFRKSAQQNEPITEVDEDDMATEGEGLHGSMALIDHDRGAQAGQGGSIARNKATGDSDIDSESDRVSLTHSLKSKQSIKSNKSSKAKAKRQKSRVSVSLRRGSISSKTSKNSAKSGSGLKNSSAAKEKQKTKRRGSFGTFRRLSIGGKSEYSGVNNGVGMNTEAAMPSLDPDGTPRSARRRSSLGSMLGNVVRRASLGGTKPNNENNTNQGPVIPEDFHQIIHRERGARGIYLFHRNIILDTLAQGIANDLASGRAPTPCEFYGNIGKGTSLSLIHSKIMEERKGISRKNILSQRFRSFGMGLAIGGEKNDSIFMCTLFME